LEIRPSIEDPIPLFKLRRTGGEEGEAVIVRPSALISDQVTVHTRAAVFKPNWPPLPRAASCGPVKLSRPSFAIRSGKYPPSRAVGVGQSEEPGPEVGCADFARREQARRDVEAQASKVFNDFGKAQIEVAGDVLEEDPLGVDLANDPIDLGPEVSRISGASSVSGQAEGLAGITGRDEMNAAAPRAAVEGSQIVPDRCWSQGLVSHPRHESGRRMCFPLDETHSSIGGLCDVQTKVEAGVSAAEGQAPKFIGVVLGT